MPSIRNAAARAGLAARLRRVTPTTTPGWGRFTAPQMVCHLSDQLRVALGEIPSRDRSTLLMRTAIKWLVVHTGFRAPPGKVRTSREMLTTSPGDWGADLATCEALLERLADSATPAAHPAFGPLSPAEWGIVAWKHFDHHLRQFGV